MKTAKCGGSLPQLITVDKSAFSKGKNINLQKKERINWRIITHPMK